MKVGNCYCSTIPKKGRFRELKEYCNNCRRDKPLKKLVEVE